MTEERLPGESTNDPPKPQSGGSALPRVITIEERDWEGEEFGPDSGLSMQFDIDGGLVAKVISTTSTSSNASFGPGRTSAS